MAENYNNDYIVKLLYGFPDKAMHLLYQRYYHGLVRLAMMFCRDALIAEEIVQDSFMVVWQNHKELATQANLRLRNYLITIVKNKAITAFKGGLRNGRVMIRNEEAVEGSDNQRSIEQALIQRELQAEIRSVISTFPKREQECLFLKLDEDLKPAAIAERLGISEKSAQRAITAGNKRLRAYWVSRR